MPEQESNSAQQANQREWRPAPPRVAAKAALKDDPRGAVLISVCAAGLLFAVWLFLYFVLFMSRGSIG